MTSTVPDAVRLDGVQKSFGEVQAVRGIDLRIRPGEIIAFLGPNGAGKTTTIDMILGLSRPTRGEVEVLGRDPRAAVSQGLVAAVMQSGGLLKDLTVRELVRYVASLFVTVHGVDEVIERAGLTDRAGRKVGSCSGGEQQRLRFAIALLSGPELLLLDEPTTGMDVEGRRSFWSAIRADASEGRTVMFATHYLEEADAYADRIVLLRQGRIVADGTSNEVRAMASGRSVRATYAAHGDNDLAGLAALPGVEQVDHHGGVVTVRAQDSDAVARYLLDLGAHDLEITARGLEDAFLALTGDAGDAGESMNTAESAADFAATGGKHR